MKTIQAYFLRTKHWQLWLLSMIGFAPFAAISIMAPTTSPKSGVTITSGLFGVSMALCVVWLLAWLAAIGTFSNSIIDSSMRLSIGIFRFAFIYPVIYCSVAGSTWLNPVNRLPMPPGVNFLHFLATFSIFYCLYFASKTLVMAQTGKPATFHDYAGPLFLIWFFPVGIWFVQPRINRLYTERKEPPKA
jgi:hypothetical protein